MTTNLQHSDDRDIIYTTVNDQTLCVFLSSSNYVQSHYVQYNMFSKICLRQSFKYNKQTYEPPCEKSGFFAYAKTKTQISFAVAVQRLCIRYIDSTIPLLSKSEISCL